MIFEGTFGHLKVSELGDDKFSFLFAYEEIILKDISVILINPNAILNDDRRIFDFYSIPLLFRKCDLETNNERSNFKKLFKIHNKKKKGKMNSVLDRISAADKFIFKPSRDEQEYFHLSAVGLIECLKHLQQQALRKSDGIYGGYDAASLNIESFWKSLMDIENCFKAFRQFNERFLIDLDNTRHEAMMNELTHGNIGRGIYFLYIGINEGKYLVMIGETTAFDGRFDMYKREWTNFRILDIFLHENSLGLENEVKMEFKAMGAQPVYSTSTEIFQLNSKYGIKEYHQAVIKASLTKKAIKWTLEDENELNVSGSSHSSGYEVSVLNSVESPQLVRKTALLKELEALSQTSKSDTGVFLKITPKKRKTTDSSSVV